MAKKRDKIKKYKIEVNKKELETILKLLESYPENTRVKLKGYPTGIADKITAKVEGSDEEVDVSDYDCW